MTGIMPWTEAVRLHPDVESEETVVATYAIDLGALVAKDPNVPPTYRDAYSFFPRNSSDKRYGKIDRGGV